MKKRAMTAARWRRACAAIALCALGLLPATSSRAADCGMTLSVPQVDYGRLSRATMVAAGDHWLLPPRTLTVTISCAEPREMTLRFRGDIADAQAFRFTEHGRFALRLHDGFLDGEPVELGPLEGQVRTTSRNGTSLPWLPDQVLAPLKGGTSAMGRVFTVQVDVQAQVDDSALNVRDATRWRFVGLIEAPSAAVAQELALQADVQAGSCQVDVVRHVSFGRLRASDLDSQGRSTPVAATQSGQLRVVCAAPTLVSFRLPRDERAGTAAIPQDEGLAYRKNQWFGLGKTHEGESIGAYALRWALHASSDQGELKATRSLDGGRTWSAEGSSVLAEHAGTERMAYADPRDATTGPLPVTTLGVTLEAEIYIAPRHTLSFHEEVEADGLATFEIIY